ncbi:unnamed protein product, partial [Rotaria magnacalcarata]
TNTSLVKGPCVVINTVAKLPNAANAAIQIEGMQVHERYATKKSALEEKSIRIIAECSLNQDIRDIGSTELCLLTTVELQIMHVYEKSRAVVVSTDSRKFVIFNKSIDYLDPRPEYIRAIIIEWPT